MKAMLLPQCVEVETLGVGESISSLRALRGVVSLRLEKEIKTNFVFSLRFKCNMNIAKP